MNGPGLHSPVGGSTVKRMLACVGSVDQSYGIEDEESDHAALGTAVHSLIERCFTDKTDAWQYIGGPVNGTENPFQVDKKMANGAQVMLDAVRKAHPDRHQGNFFVERRFHCPTIHPLFLGTCDLAYLDTPAGDDLDVHIWDFKNGVMNVEANSGQGSYYGCGVLEDFGLWTTARKVFIHIVQPNGFHPDGPVRVWETTPDALAEWLEDVLIPGIEASVGPTDKPRPLASGEHCVFCPARGNACPQLTQDMSELEAMMAEIEKKGADALTNAQVGRFLDLLDLGKIVGKAAGATAFKRIQGGGRIPGRKLAKAKANRSWKDNAEIEVGLVGGVALIPVADAARAVFGSQAFTAPELKSPAQIEELPLGKDFATRHASKPDNGLTLVKDTDARMEVSTDTKSLFTDVTKQSVSPTVDGLIAVGGVVDLPVAVRRKKPALA
jgi:hypothetical protein